MPGMGFGSTNDDYSSDDSVTSQIVSSVLQSATQLGQSYIFSQQKPNPVLSYPYAPPNSLSYVGGGAQGIIARGGQTSSVGMLAIVAIIIALAFVLFRK